MSEKKKPAAAGCANSGPSSAKPRSVYVEEVPNACPERASAKVTPARVISQVMQALGIDVVHVECVLVDVIPLARLRGMATTQEQHEWVARLASGDGVGLRLWGDWDGYRGFLQDDGEVMIVAPYVDSAGVEQREAPAR